MAYFMKHCRDSLGSFWVHNVTGTPDHPGGIYRAHVEKFYHRKQYHFVYPIHEQLKPKHPGFIPGNLQMNSAFGHDGYCMDEEMRLQKAERNRALLQKQIAGDPDNPYLFYQLGKTCQMTEDHDGACGYFGKALEYDLDPTLDYVNDLVVQYGDELLCAGRVEEALGFEGIREEFGATADFVYLMGKIYMENGRYQEAVNEFQKALTIKDCRSQGCNSYLPAYRIGKICIMAGQNDKAVTYLKSCGNYPPALELLKTIS
jgi:tetratricopeptide (TPR) repeat protein